MSSSPWPPQIVSLPSRPRMTSLTSPPRITSGPAVPTMKSAAAVPRIVTAFPSHVGGFGAMPPASARPVTTAARATTVSVVAASWAVNLVRIAVLLSVVAYADTTAERRVPYGSIAGRRCESPVAAKPADEPPSPRWYRAGLGAGTRRGRRRVLALILAGGEGSRLGALAEERAKPALPFGGIYRLIDFPLSNCVHSGLGDAWVLQQYEPHELTTQLANGRPWDLDRTRGGFRIVHPSLGDGRSGWYQGNADALHRNQEVIRRFDADLLLVLSADHVYRLDYGDVIDGHVAADGRVTAFEYKPDSPRSRVVATEVFLYDAPTLMDTLDDLAGGGDDGLQDFGHELLPRLVSDGRARAHPLDGYWRDVGTLDSYWQSQMDLLEPDPPFVLDDPAWPILTAGLPRSPARIERSASLDASWVAPAAVVRGHVERSILGPGVFVDEGAVVRESILFHDVQVASGATVERTIADENAVVQQGATVGTAGGGITVVARGAATGDRFAPSRDDVA